METINLHGSNHILVGLGGTGGKVLKAIRKRLFLEFPNGADRAKLPVGFVYVDSTREMMQYNDPSFKVMGVDASFTESEFVDIKESVSLDKILDNVDSFPGLKYVVPDATAMRDALGEVGAGAGQKRRAGRIFFAAHCDRYIAALRAQYDKVRTISRKDSVNIHLFVGLAGGTGSGAIIDAVAQIRAQASFRDAVITVYAMIPEREIPCGCQAGRYHQNGYAALSELSALNVGCFQPSDVIRGDEHIALDWSANAQFGLMLYSNVDENGTTVNSFTELPQLLADLVYFLMFLEHTDATLDLIRGLRFESVGGYSVEYNTKLNGADIERARTKAIGSFGIKRIIYPESRILKHISYTVGEQLLRQMLYNHFNESYGYAAQGVKKDYKQLYMDDANLRDWRLSDSFLTLDENIYDTDKDFDSINTFWKSVTNFYSYGDAKAADKEDPLIYLRSVCEEKFENNFRSGEGVEAYYHDKRDDRMLKKQANYIVERIERDLYTRWYEGELSLDDLLHICDEILAYIKNRSAKMDADITACGDEVMRNYDATAVSEYKWFHINIIKRMFGASARHYEAYQEILTALYVGRTFELALKFQESLLVELIAAFEEYYAQISAFADSLLVSLDMVERRIADCSQTSKGLSDLSKTVIEVSEGEKMIEFERSVILDKYCQEDLSMDFRKAIVGGRTFAHFDELAAQGTEEIIFGLLDAQLTERIRVIHDQEWKQDKILGVNVLQQLQKELLTDDDIMRFASYIASQSGVLLNLDAEQLGKALNNNQNPASNPESNYRKTILVNLPSSEGNDALKVFAVKLENALKGAFGYSKLGSSVHFNISDQRMNEITIVTLKYIFPVRAISWMANYEKEYNDLVQHPDSAIAAECRILLHSEGDGTQLPDVMGEKIISLKEFIPYLFIAAANGFIDYIQDVCEEKGWCMVTVDEWGCPMVTFIAANFTDIPTCEELTSDMRGDIQELVDNLLKNPELKAGERVAMGDKVKILVRDFVAKECSSLTSPKYLQFVTDAKKALEMINIKR